MLVNFAIQIQWISYATIISESSRYYGVSHQMITLLSMVFMIAFIPLSLPAAWVIDTRGFRIAVGFGVILMGVFGITRGLAGSNYAVALASTIGIAIAQPFLLDAWTKVPANWFPAGERATAVGLITLASMLGVAFVIMGVFNGVTSWVGDIILPRGFGSTDAAILGAVMLVVGVIGAVVLGAISDRHGKRVRYLALALALAVPCLVGVAFISTVWLLYLSAAALGFFIVGALPIGKQ